LRLRSEVDTRTPVVVLRDVESELAPLPPAWLGAPRRRRAALNGCGRHRLLLIDTTSDGPQTVDLIVEEPIPKHLLERAWLLVDDLGLRVPGGQLALSGLDDLGRGRRLDARIPPGSYRVSVLAPDWSLDEVPLEEPDVSRVGWVVVTTNALLACAALASVALLVVGIVRAWSAAMPWAAGLLLLAWTTALALQRPGRGERSRMHRAALDARFPAIVVRLRRLPDDDAVLDLAAGHVDFNQPIDRPLPSASAPEVEPVG
jgi:hypothetical protein